MDTNQLISFAGKLRCDTYMVPLTVWCHLCTGNMKTLATSLLIAAQSCPFNSTEATRNRPTPLQFSFKINDIIIFIKIYIRGPANVLSTITQ